MKKLLLVALMLMVAATMLYAENINLSGSNAISLALGAKGIDTSTIFSVDLSEYTAGGIPPAIIVSVSSYNDTLNRVGGTGEDSFQVVKYYWSVDSSNWTLFGDYDSSGFSNGAWVSKMIRAADSLGRYLKADLITVACNSGDTGTVVPKWFIWGINQQ